ncbi:MAG: protoheme IX farnesyltransferase [Ignavibacteriae bacterium]|nr:protoheme IX farnesyltransferase [Ignavibacteriota bacterium]
MSVNVTANQIENGIIETLKSFFQTLVKHKNILIELTKFKITFFVSVTTTVGFILFDAKINFDLLIVTLGVLFLAAGASALNEYQERNLDGKMPRTITRPIPSGRISAKYALTSSMILIFFGSVILFISGKIVLALGIFTLLWYNLIYTPLKLITPFAIIPGSLVGALPPMIGWAAAGGEIFEYKILALAGFLFIWQIPHFWLLILMYDDQYKKAGFPTLSNIFSFLQIKIITYFWILILVLSSYVFFQVRLSEGIFSNILLIIFGSLTLALTIFNLQNNSKQNFRNKFLIINAYVLSVLLLITTESLI